MRSNYGLLELHPIYVKTISDTEFFTLSENEIKALNKLLYESDLLAGRTNLRKLIRIKLKSVDDDYVYTLSDYTVNDDVSALVFTWIDMMGIKEDNALKGVVIKINLVYSDDGTYVQFEDITMVHINKEFTPVE